VGNDTQTFAVIYSTGSYGDPDNKADVKNVSAIDQV
jgi:hypothetical protein